MAKMAVIDRKKLVDGLAIIKDVIKPDSKDAKDSSNYVIIQNGFMHCVSNMFMVTIPFGIELEKDVVNVEFQLLFDYLKKRKEKEIKLCVTPNMTLGIIASSASKSEIALMDEFTFDYDALAIPESEWKPLPESFASAMAFTAWSADLSDADWSHVTIHNGKMYGQNGKDRVTCYDMQEAGRSSFAENLLYVHAYCFDFVNKYMGFDPMRGAPRYAVKGSWLHLRTLDGVIMSSRTRADNNFEADFVDDMLRQGDSPAFRFTPEFAEMLDRANPFSGKSMAVKTVNIEITNELVRGDKKTDAGEGTSFMILRAAREDGSRIYEQCLVRRVEHAVRFSIGYSALESMLKYGETFRVGNGKLTAIGSTHNGKDDGTPIFRAIAMLSTN